MIRKKYEDIVVDYYGKGENAVIKDEADFILSSMNPNDAEKIIKLKEIGFSFLDRTILAELPINSESRDMEKYVRLQVQLQEGEEVFSEEIYEIAKKAFVWDRRFHLEEAYDDAVLAGKMITGYLDGFRDEHDKVIKCFHRDLVVGFIVIKDIDGRICENVLGAVRPEYQSRGAAVSLYCGMMRELGKLGYKAVRGRISTKNDASLNLHCFLGDIRFSEPEDVYVYRRERER